MTNLNTSHVNVNRMMKAELLKDHLHLNTSHVNVNPRKIKEI